jgi:hypothetical protein
MPDITTDEVELTRRAGRLNALLEHALGPVPHAVV